MTAFEKGEVFIKLIVFFSALVLSVTQLFQLLKSPRSVSEVDQAQVFRRASPVWLQMEAWVKPPGESCKAITSELQTAQVEQIASYPKVMVHNYLPR